MVDLLHPTEETILAISAQREPVLRNLQITYCYYLLSETLVARLGREANWCTFATWASRQAGSTIRKEDLTNALEASLSGAEFRKDIDIFRKKAKRFGIRLKDNRLVEIAWKTIDPEAMFSYSSDAVARGNLKVFAEIGREFSRFIDRCLQDSSPDPENLEAFIATLKPGPPPDGQDTLRFAFRNYYSAMFEENPKIRSERILLANLQIGYHEQTRLQPEIVEALQSPVPSPATFTNNLVHAYYPEKPWLANMLLRILQFAGRFIGFDDFIDRYLLAARRQGQHLSTQMLMSIKLPPEIRLRLGDDLKGVFPSELRSLTVPALIDLLDKIDPTSDSLDQSGAVYWGDLPDRLHFIADLFRSFHFSSALFDLPFTPEQVQVIMADAVPEGKL